MFDIAEKLRVIRNLMAGIEKQFGKGAIMTLAEEGTGEPVREAVRHIVDFIDRALVDA